MRLSCAAVARSAATFVLIAAGAALSASGWVTLGGDGRARLSEAPQRAPAVGVLQSTESALTVRAGTPAFYAKESPGKATFTTLSLPDGAQSGEIGRPALPVLRRLVLAPTGAKVVLRVDQAPATRVALGALGLPAWPAPAQAPVVKQPGALEKAPFAFDEDYYLRGGKPEPAATITEAGVWRGQRVMLLELRPFAYDAPTKSLLWRPDLQAKVTFAGGRWTGVRSDDPLVRLALNGEQAARPAPLQTGTGRILVISGLGLSPSVAPYVSDKTAQGYTVDTFTTLAGATKEQIKAEIKARYDVVTTRPDYVVLVGDTDTIPNWVGNTPDNPAHDLGYVCMDAGDDWMPDIAIGRFPAQNATQLGAMLDKTYRFEAAQFSDPSYCYRAVFMASVDNWAITEGTHNWTITNHMIPNGFVSDKLYVHSYNATTAQTRACFNGGRFFGVYSGHGSETYWADGPVFYPADVNGLSNDGMFALVASFSCLTGRYQLAECFMETWVRAANKGAVTAWGSSVTSYWTEDDVLQKRLFDVIYDNTDAVPAEIGPVIRETKLRYLAQMGSGTTTRRYFEMYNLFGDPALRITSGIVAPSIRTAPTNLTVPEGGTADFTVKLSEAPSSDVIVSVEFGSGDTDIQIVGPATLTFTPDDWDAPQTVTLAAAQDDDNTYGSANIRCVSANWNTGIVVATELDDEPYGDVYEPDNDASQAKTIVTGAPQNRSIDPASDVDWVRFEAVAGKFYTLGTTGSQDMYLYLYQPDATTEITHDDDGGDGANSLIEWPCTISGTYYLKVRHYNASAIGDYGLYVTEQSSLGDAYEPDNSASEAKWIVANGVRQPHTIRPAGEGDWMRFVAVSGKTYVIETFGSYDTFLHLYGTDGSTQLASDDDSGEGYCSRIQWTCTTGGTYFVKARGYSSSSTGAYDISVTGPTAAISGRIVLGGVAPLAGRIVTIQSIQPCCPDAPAETRAVTLAADGSFAFTSGIVGLMEFRVKGSHWLARRTGVLDVPATGTAFDLTGARELLNGDITDDNLINLDDFLRLAAAYEATPVTDAACDLNEDGSVNLDDFLVLAANYEVSGE